MDRSGLLSWPWSLLAFAGMLRPENYSDSYTTSGIFRRPQGIIDVSQGRDSLYRGAFNFWTSACQSKIDDKKCHPEVSKSHVKLEFTDCPPWFGCCQEGYDIDSQDVMSFRRR